MSALLEPAAFPDSVSRRTVRGCNCGPYRLILMYIGGSIGDRAKYGGVGDVLKVRWLLVLCPLYHAQFTLYIQLPEVLVGLNESRRVFKLG